MGCLLMLGITAVCVFIGARFGVIGIVLGVLIALFICAKLNS